MRNAIVRGKRPAAITEKVTKYSAPPAKAPAPRCDGRAQGHSVLPGREEAAMQRYIVRYPRYDLLKRELQVLAFCRSRGTRRQSSEWEERNRAELASILLDAAIVIVGRRVRKFLAAHR
eukprot:12310077-Alexandrium_andersonii.AAC.1